ncbi:MAG: NAD(P)-dependent oxidoreductase [Pseudomonadota bacterium]
MTILITGATGCVGRYIVDRFLAETGHDLLLLVRRPEALPLAVREESRVRVERLDLADPALALPDLSSVRVAILVATAWGGPEAVRVIRDANLALSDRLIEAGCQRIMYFSTASVLDADTSLLEAARDYGTEYIRGKLALTEAMEARADRAEIVGLFPTLVIGGQSGGDLPLSHFANLLHQLRRWVWLLRFLDVEAKLHVIHAADIATICVHLSDQDEGGSGSRRLVLGNPADSVDALVRGYAGYVGLARLRLLRLRPALAQAFIWLFGIQLSPWDRYCMEHPDQSYQRAVNPAQFGLPVHMADLRAGLREIGVKPR